MALPTTPAHDTPVVTFATLAGATTGPGIAGSAGWQREKRIGVATTAPGGTQTSTANLDVAGDTRFRYPSLPAGKGSSFSAGNIVAPDGYIPGGTSVAQWWPFNVEFETSSPVVELRLNAVAASPRLGMILVNGLPVQLTEFVATGIASAAYYAARLTFPDSRSRRIAIYGLQQMLGRFGGAAVQSGYSIVRPTATRRVLLVGDSYLAGTGVAPTGATITETFGLQVALAMGADDVTLAGIGGTGWTKTINSESVSVFNGRLADALALDPPASAVVFIGGRNDGSGTATLASAVATALSTVSAVPEKWIVTTTGAAQTAVVTEILAGAGAVPVIDTTAVTRDTMADTVHPTAAGHQTLAEYVIAAMPEEYTGTAGLSGAGTLAAAGAPAVAAAAGLSGAGTLSAVGVPAVTRTVALSGAGTASATGAPAFTRASALSGAGTLTATGAPAVARAVALSGGGAVAAAGAPSYAAGAALSGGGTLAAAQVGGPSGAAALTGAGTLTAAGVPAVAAQVTRTGGGTLTITARPEFTGAVVLTGGGSLAAEQEEELTVSGPYATRQQVVVVLGKLGPRVEQHGTVDIDQHLAMAHSDVLDRLFRVYGRGTLPTWTPDGAAVLQWAEARLAAAAILDILRASMPSDASDVPDKLRESALASLEGGVPGSPVGDAVPGPAEPVPDPGLPVASTTATSNFTDPYSDAWLDGYDRQGRGGLPPGAWSSL